MHLTTRVDEMVEIPKAVETAVFRIIQQALTKVGQHAEATEISVLLVSTRTEIRAVVDDNVRGFAPAETSRCPSLGIVGMRERARLVGGTVEIESATGRGTTVVLQVPLEHRASGRNSTTVVSAPTPRRMRTTDV
jgi:two-component system sensor kinase